VTVDFTGKRIAALDYGEARIGMAICDELHIVVSTRPFIPNGPDVLQTVQSRLADDRIDVVVVGVPILHDDRTTPIIESIRHFIDRLRVYVDIPVVEADEAFSTKSALALLRSSGARRSARTAKGRKDEVAAAVILRDFLETL